MTAAKGQVSRFVTKGSKRRRSTTATLGSLQQLGAPSTSTNSYQNAGQRLIRAGETGLIQAMCRLCSHCCAFHRHYSLEVGNCCCISAQC